MGFADLICQTIAFRPGMLTVLFAIPCTVGWLPQWQVLLLDNQRKIARPLQLYTGERKRAFQPTDFHVAGPASISPMRIGPWKTKLISVGLASHGERNYV